jgi:hypothetical protein
MLAANYGYVLEFHGNANWFNHLLRTGNGHVVAYRRPEILTTRRTGFYIL